MRLDRFFLQEVEDYAAHLRAALASIEEYSGQVDQEFRQGQVENIIGNPVYTYQLIKRISVFWRNVEVGLYLQIILLYIPLISVLIVAVMKLFVIKTFNI